MQSVLGADERFTCILADPPWVRSQEVGRFPLDPLTAIDGGTDGLDLARICVSLIGRHLADDGVAVLQLGDTTQVAAIESHLDSKPHLDLCVQDIRCPGDNGVLVPVGHGAATS